MSGRWGEVGQVKGGWDCCIWVRLTSFTTETGQKREMIYRTFEKFTLAVGEIQTKSRSRVLGRRVYSNPARQDREQD